MALSGMSSPPAFRPRSYASFRFTSRALSDDGIVTLGYALDDELAFCESFALPVRAPVTSEARESVEGLLELLHLVAGVSYFKMAVPPRVECAGSSLSPETADLLDALYSEGLAEFAYRNCLPDLPRPRFPRGAPTPRLRVPASQAVLVPVGGGKDSIVAIEVVRRSGRPFATFSIGDAIPIRRTVAVAGTPHLLARRWLDPKVRELNAAGALNGHVPVTAIVSLVALVTAVLNGYGSVAMANESSASVGNLKWRDVDVNHQFSKSQRAEQLLQGALRRSAPGLAYFSVLSGAKELAITRAFAQMSEFHLAFTSCNAVFRLDPELCATSWCRDCPKCRFVFLALAPFLSPDAMESIFGGDMLADTSQTQGFALLTATGGHKPFECVGEEQESVAALRLLASDERWQDHAVVRSLIRNVLEPAPAGFGEPAEMLVVGQMPADVPADLVRAARAVLSA